MELQGRTAGGSASQRYEQEASANRRRWLLVGLLAAAAACAAWVAIDAGSYLWALPAALFLLGARVLRPQPDPERWLRGAAGEEATAAVLERLPPHRWVVLHDRAIPGSVANIDHLVVGPSGLWVIDTKVLRAPLRVRRRRLWAGTRRLGFEALSWEAARVEERLGVPARPLVVVHGSGLRRRGHRLRGVRVVPLEGLLRLLRRGRRRFGGQDVRLLGAQAAAAFPPRRSPRGPPSGPRFGSRSG